jgi:carbon storage regulator
MRPAADGERNQGMLVVSRKEHQRLLIGSDVELTVVHIGEKRVRLGIRAPEEVSIKREELAFAEVDAIASEAMEPQSGPEAQGR